MRDFSDDLSSLRRRLDDAARYLNVDALRARLDELTEEMGQPGFWDDQARARTVGKEHGQVNSDVELMDRLTRRLDDAETLYELAVEEDDDSQETEIADAVNALLRELDGLELRSLFSGEYD
jgi:peptide chain release factor 2